MADPLKERVAALLGEPRPAGGSMQLEALHTGGNNRVFMLKANERKLIVKQYYRHPSDKRDRFHSEQAFLRFAQESGLKGVPRVVASAPEDAIAIHEFIEGRRLEAAEISARHVAQAARFFLELNDRARSDLARELPQASEACFSVDDHIALVDLRVSRLAEIPAGSNVDGGALEFGRRLGGCWRQIRDGIRVRVREHGFDPGAVVDERCVSPSDFGFHNALLQSDGNLCFLDFEYAGWDDPAKMAGDFFSHPGVPVPAAHFDEFVRVAMSYSGHAERLALRTRLLAPLFRIKWCCIILNEFIPDAARRRRFADPGIEEAARKANQLEKARRLLSSISDWDAKNGLH
jgi:hypothetical protein